MKFLFTGDTALLGSAESTKQKDYSLKLSNEVKELFRDEVFSVVNLEAPLTNAEKPILKTGPNIKSNPESVRLLNDLNVNLACLSNNHIRDYGNQGVVDTIKHCTANNIDVIGAGKNLKEASKPHIIENGGQKYVFLNFSEQEYNTASDKLAGSNPDDEIHIWRSIEENKGQFDVLIVVMHGGKEMHPYPTPEQMKLYRFIIDLGADMVIGHHSHIMGGYEFYQNKPIIYSLGNFIFDEKGNPEAWYSGVVAQVEFSERSIVKLQIYNTTLQNNTLDIIDKQDLLTKKETGFFHYVTEELVNEQWEKLVQQHIQLAAKSLLNFGLLRRALWKTGNTRLRYKDKKHLMVIGNRLSCRTHNLFYQNIIEKINN